MSWAMLWIVQGPYSPMLVLVRCRTALQPGKWSSGVGGMPREWFSVMLEYRARGAGFEFFVSLCASTTVLSRSQLRSDGSSIIETTQRTRETQRVFRSALFCHCDLGLVDIMLSQTIRYE